MSFSNNTLETYGRLKPGVGSGRRPTSESLHSIITPDHSGPTVFSCLMSQVAPPLPFSGCYSGSACAPCSMSFSAGNGGGGVGKSSPF